MALQHSPSIVTSGLLLCYDAANPRSYPGSGTTIYDISGNGYTGTLTNGVGYTSSNLGSFVFDAVDDYIASGINIPNTSAFSLACFTKPAGSQVQYSGIMGNHGGTYTGIYCQQQSTSLNNYVWGYGNGSSWGTGCTFSLISNNWCYLVLVKDSTYNYVYINGVLVNTVATNGTASLGGYNISFGRDYDTSRYYNGNISNGQVYNRAINVTEIVQNFNALRGRYGI